MEEVWESGGGIAQIPSQTNNPLPKPPASCFALHSAANNLQLLCYGGKPMVRAIWLHAASVSHSACSRTRRARSTTK
jgi:hypothetical protein